MNSYWCVYIYISTVYYESVHFTCMNVAKTSKFKVKYNKWLNEYSWDRSSYRQLYTLTNRLYFLKRVLMFFCVASIFILSFRHYIIQLGVKCLCSFQKNNGTNVGSSLNYCGVCVCEREREGGGGLCIYLFMYLFISLLAY